MFENVNLAVWVSWTSVRGAGNRKPGVGFERSNYKTFWCGRDL